MTPVVALFNSAGGVGTTRLGYHVAWMLRRLGLNVVAVDLDPQASLTSAFLDDRDLEELWGDERRTVYAALTAHQNLELSDPYLHEVEPGLWLLPGDLLLSEIEEDLNTVWPKAGDGDVRAQRKLASFAPVAQRAAEAAPADIVLLDLGPNLSAVNRAALVAADHVVVPLATDLHLLQGLRSLGPALRRWRREWTDRRQRAGDLWVPEGAMQPAGYVVLQRGVRVDRTVGDYDRWLRRMPVAYRQAVLGESDRSAPPVADDPQCLGVMKTYHGLAWMAEDARRPTFLLRSADGASATHQHAVQAAYHQYAELTRRLAGAVGAGKLIRW